MRVPSQGVHSSHHRFGATSLIWWAVEWLREPLPFEDGTFIQITSSPLKEKEDNCCPSRSPIKPSVEPGRSVVSVTKRNSGKEIFKLSIRRLSIPASERRWLPAPFTPIFCKRVNSILVTIFNGEPGMTRPELTDEQKKILERMHKRVDYIFQAYKEYFYALAEYDKTGVLKIRGKVLIERREK